MPRAQTAVLLATAVFALACLVGTPYPALAPLQNLPTLAILLALGAALRRWPMPAWTVALVCLFLALHTLGGRYIYSFVPYDSWFASLGLPEPTVYFGLARNHYDRLVHFSFGLLIAAPIATALTRYAGLTPRWSAYVALEFVLAGSALYEIFEWLLTLAMASESADAYNGQQGDIWDAQKDMALAFGGALVATLAMAFHQRRAR